MVKSTVSFRQQTISVVADLLDDEKMLCASSQKLISYLVGKLINYREEGEDLDVRILYCEKIDEVLKILPGAVYYRIGKVSFIESAGKTILKDCAPLCGSNWLVYIERESPGIIVYGVFSFERSPTSLALQDSMHLMAGEFALLIQRINVETVEIIGSRGSHCRLEFSTGREGNADTKSNFQLFASDCVSEIDDTENKEKFLQYMARLVADAALDSHGTILVCCGDFEKDKPKEMSDAVLIDPKLDFFDAFQSYLRMRSSESITHLFRIEDLLKGFFSCDGVVIFDAKGRIVAYRGFFRSGEETGEVVGGARRRAFEGIKKLVGASFISALFRSQDGLTIYEGPSHE